jgi:hypothetical protein
MRILSALAVGLLLVGCVRNAAPEAEQEEPAVITVEGRAEIRAFLESELRTGFRTADEAIESTAYFFEDEYGADALQEAARELCRDLVGQLIGEAKEWPPRTDCDRLDSAFADLESRGVLARQDFSCCQTCGANEIRDAMKAEERKGLQVRGYTFFHEQNTESAVEGRGLYLSYGSVSDEEEAALGIAKEVVDTLSKHGLTTEWDGTLETCIHVKVDWKRRGPWMKTEPALGGGD